LHQALEYLFSQRGDYIRDYLVDELVKSLDILSRNAWANARAVVGEWFGVTNNHKIPSPSEQKTLDNIQRIWGILQQTKGFDSMKVLDMIPELIMKPQLQQMGQQVASRLAQRAIARLLREFLMSQETSMNTSMGYSPPTSVPLSLPPSK
jgi:hypothetical protein